MGNTKVLTELVKKESERSIGTLDFIHDAEKKAKAMAHHDACKALWAFSQKSGFPISVLLYIGVGTSAHKPSNFENIVKFDEKKCDKVVKMAKAFAKHFGGKETLAHNANLIHAICRFVKCGGKSADFRTYVKSLPTENFSIGKYKNAKEIGKFIFGEFLDLNERGYIYAE